MLVHRLALIALLWLPFELGQPVQAQVPPDHLYRAFFGHVVFLQTHAQNMPTDNPNRVEVLSYYQKRLDISATDATILNRLRAQLMQQSGSKTARPRQS
jgi:hypothetical protein